MTRDEAFKVASAGDTGDFVAKDVVTILGRLGILQFDPPAPIPRTATEKATEAINRHIAVGGSTMTTSSLCEMMAIAGVRIVDK
jgi:hypothetical protein